MNKVLIFIFFFNFSYAQKTIVLDKDNSSITYGARHILTKWEGINNDIGGVIVYENTISKIAISAKLIDFNSGNSGRDLHLLEYMDLLRHPYIKFYSEKIKFFERTITFDGELEFYGKKKSLQILATAEENDNEIILKGEFQLIPSEYFTTLPRFQLIKIENLFNINFSLRFLK